MPSITHSEYHGIDKKSQSMHAVPDIEQPYEICNSLGCPMVSENYFLELDKYIATSTKPVLLEIFY